MDLIAYRFDCWPLTGITTGDPELDKELKEETDRNFKNRLDILDELFSSSEEVHYMLGDSTQPPFKVKNDLILRTYKTARVKVDEAVEEEYGKLMAEGKLREAEKLREVKEPGDYTKIPKAVYDEHIPARVIYDFDHAFVLRIQKKRPLEGEDKNYKTVIYKENYVSSLAVLVFKEGMQYILIEDTRKTYAPATIARFFEHSFNRLLMSKYHMMCTVNPILRLSDFWKQLEGFIQLGHRIKSHLFMFDSLNMLWPDDLLGGRFKRLGKKLNAESEMVFRGQHGQMLDIQTKEEERDPDVNSMARYSCDKGNKAITELDDKSVHTFGYKQAGTVSVFLPDKIGEVQENKNPELFPEDYGQKVMEEARKLSMLNG